MSKVTTGMNVTSLIRTAPGFEFHWKLSDSRQTSNPATPPSPDQGQAEPSDQERIRLWYH